MCNLFYLRSYLHTSLENKQGSKLLVIATVLKLSHSIARPVNFQIDHQPPAVVNVKKNCNTSRGQFEHFLPLVSVDKTEVTGKIFLVPRYILKIKECHVISF